MAPPIILPEYGYDSSCGDFQVKVIEKQPNSGDPAAASVIEVQYDELIDSDHRLYGAAFPWKGGEVSVVDVEALLNTARVPFFIQFVSAIDMIFRFVDAIVKDSNQRPGLMPSILVKISSHKETFEWDSEFDCEEDEC